MSDENQLLSDCYCKTCQGLSEKQRSILEQKIKQGTDCYEALDDVLGSNSWRMAIGKENNLRHLVQKGYIDNDLVDRDISNDHDYPFGSASDPYRDY